MCVVKKNGLETQNESKINNYVTWDKDTQQHMRNNNTPNNIKRSLFINM